jgi:hypothetical protein
MPRSCEANSPETLFDADEHIANLQEDIAQILFVVGLDPANFENYELEEIITALRETFSIRNASIGRDPVYPFVYGQYRSLLHKLRNDFLYLQISKYGKQL